MFPHEAQTLPGRKKTPSKLIVGLAAFLTTGIITASGFAGATNGQNKPSQEECKRAGFSSLTECEQAMKSGNQNQTQHNQQGNSINHGYGGGNTSVATNINVAVNGNNNIVQIIVNIFR